MRKFALIVMLVVAAILGSLTTAHASAPVREPLELEDFVFDGCGFPMFVDVVVNKEFTTTFFDDAGNPVRQIISGRLTSAFSNLDTGERIVRDTSGPGELTFNADGSATLDARGNWFFFFDPGDLPSGAVSPAFVTHGRFILTFEADGSQSIEGLTGYVEDICAILGS
jgi:hypothetical protein